MAHPVTEKPERRPRRRRRAWAAALLAAALPAQASFIFFPGLDEYAPLARGPYVDFTLDYTHIDKIYDETGQSVDLGGGQVPPGESLESVLLLPRFLWIGNVFRDTKVPILNTRNQVFRLIQPIGWQMASANLRALDERFGLKSRGAGLGDTFLLFGLYGHEHHWGVMHFNGLLATTFKLPYLGQYDEQSLLNVGTNYLTIAPQLAGHAEFFGRLFVDATAAYQVNYKNDKPAFGGLYPSDPADVYNLEGSFGWKWAPRFYTTVGALFRASIGANRYANPDLNLVQQPTPANPPLIQIPGLVSALLPVPLPAPPNPAIFFTSPHPGIYQDQGVRATMLSFGFNYVHRDSLVFDFRVLWPVEGKGSFFKLPYDTYLAVPSLTQPGAYERGPFLTTVNTRVSGVGEAAAIPASPQFLFRIVWLPWAP
ncbi:MAG: transporter [Sinobacteraceae bacterium]|nr:transporter [Nevskiaceae bacterium]